MTRGQIEKKVRKINQEQNLNLDICKTMQALKERLRNMTWKDVNDVMLTTVDSGRIRCISMAIQGGSIGIGVEDDRLKRNYKFELKGEFANEYN